MMKRLFVATSFFFLLLLPSTAFAAVNTNLVSCWNLNESSGNAVDSVGSNTLTNSNVTYVAGLIGNAASFNGTTADLSITNASQTGLGITGDMSISAWVKYSTVTNYSTLVSKFGSTNNTRAYRLLAKSDTILFQQGIVVGTNVNTVTWPVTLTTGVWYHIVLVFTAAGGTADLYLNGSQQAQKSGLSVLTSNTTAPFSLGKSDNPDENWNTGLEDIVGIWNRTLNSGDVSSLYNAGAGFACPFTPTALTTSILGLVRAFFVF